jgi:hypothetical protein
MQPDPLGIDAAELTDPQSLNLYSYCENDPINHVDPDGLFFKKLFGWIGKAFKFLFKVLAVALFVVAMVLLPTMIAWGGFYLASGTWFGWGSWAGLMAAAGVAGLAGWHNGTLGKIAGAFLTRLSGGGNFRTPNTFPNGTGVGPINKFQAAEKSSAKPNIAPIIFVGAIETINIVDKAPDEAPSTFSDCFNKYKFTSSVGTLFGPTAESVAEVISVTSYISFAGDMVATAVKAASTQLGRPQRYASGINWAIRRLSRGAVRGTLTTIGGAVSNSLAVTAVFTGAYDLSIAAQCASGILK